MALASFPCSSMRFTSRRWRSFHSFQTRALSLVQGRLSFFVTGVNSYVSAGEEGDLTLVSMSDIDGFFGQLNNFQLWDRALNLTEIRQISASPNNLTGDEEGLCIYWQADRGYGSRVPNLGSAGADYDATLGEYTNGPQTSAVYGTGCDAVSTTPPTWANKTAGVNTPPFVQNATLQVIRYKAPTVQLSVNTRMFDDAACVTQVIESTSDAPASATLYFIGGFDTDGDLLDYAVTRLPSHGVLELVSTVNATAPNVPITSTPFRCWETFSRYRLAWWPAENSNEPVTIGYKAWDGSDFSDEANLELTIQPIDGIPNAVAMSYTLDEDTELSNITLCAIDDDTDFLSIFLTSLPTHGTLYALVHYNNKSGDWVRREEITRAYSPWNVVEPIEQYASNVRAVSTFWPADDITVTGYPSWHVFQILGPQDSPNNYADSNLAYCPSSFSGGTAGIQSGGDEYISFSHDTWASYLSDGYTEYVEVPNM